MISKKTHLLVLLTLIWLIGGSCEKTRERKETQFYFIRKSGSDNKIDTLKLKNFSFHPNNDSLFREKAFILFNRPHTLRKYSNIGNSGIDGGHFIFELDNYGIVFYSSLTWKSQKRLYSSNDSINNIIDHAIEEALILSELDFERSFSKNTKKVLEFR